MVGNGERNASMLEALGEYAWRGRPCPADVFGPASMLLNDERAMLYYLTKEYYEGDGLIIDAGCFLGGSSYALAKGLMDRTDSVGRIFDQPIRSFDLFKVEKWAVGMRWETTSELEFVMESYVTRHPGASTRDLFEAQIQPVKELIHVHEGDILTAPLPTENIEILFLDVLKTPEINDYASQAFFPKLIEGHSLLIQQDYLFARGSYYIHVTMEALSEYFHRVTNTFSNSVVFLYAKALPQDMDLSGVYRNLSGDQKLAYMDSAIAKWNGRNRDILIEAKAQMKEVEGL